MNENSTIQLSPTPVTGGMKELLQNSGFSMPKEGDTIEGRVIEKGRNKIFLDLGPFRTGVVYKGEIDLSLYDLTGVNVGDVLPVKILELENEEGLVELSLREAGLDRAWQDLKELKESGEVFKITVQDANRGGLIIQLKGIQGFLPVSQLSPENYPHVEGGDKEEIFRRLKEFIGRQVEVKVLDLDRKSLKLIFSERARASRELKEKLAAYTLDQVIEGEISGIVDFGAFVTFDGIEGLVHISELGWQLVEHPESVVSIKDKVSAKIIAIENDKVSLSLKALKPNPWDEVEKNYALGGIVEGVVSKLNPFGVFVKIGEEIQGLAHISEFKSYEDMVSYLELGKKYNFRITMLEPKEYKMALRLISLEQQNKESEAPASVVPTDNIKNV